ncbi:Hyaluronan/mRNA binding family [Abeliophyllum distichum]|uniref:Hyaluronan/mRNA binding family n=1 Tax=Abeliophyllum distichum TaxID=126358 RepID=A0ABD1RS34_9LAMI
MATVNPFDLLGVDDTEDPSQLIQKIEPKKALTPAAKPAGKLQAQQPNKPANAKLPSKPVPPAQAVREGKSEFARGRGGGRGYGRGRAGGGGSNRESTNNENSYKNRDFSGGPAANEEADTGKSFERSGGFGSPRGSFRGGRRGGFNNGEVLDGERDQEQERPRRAFDRRSGTGRGNDIKREGSGRGNWGTQSDELSRVTDEVNEGEKNLNVERPAGEEDVAEESTETPAKEVEEKESEDKEMTLEEYEKVLEEKRKALQALKTEERKVDVKVFESMQQLANKKSSDDIFIKLGSDKYKRKELADKEERAKKSVSINEFLKPTEGERYYSPGGRGRGRGRGRGSGGGYSGSSQIQAPSIEDQGHFPTLGAK